MTRAAFHRHRCDDCGRVVPWQDIADGLAKHCMSTPDTAFSPETYTTYCVRCRVSAFLTS